MSVALGFSFHAPAFSTALTSGYLNGIARRVVLMSGIAGLIGLSGDLIRGFTEEYGQAQAKTFWKRMNIDSMDQLIKLSTDDIMGRFAEIVKDSDLLLYTDSLFWPRVSTFASVDPFRAAAKVGSHGIDVMIRYTAYEMGPWLLWDDSLEILVSGQRKKF